MNSKPPNQPKSRIPFYKNKKTSPQDFVIGTFFKAGKERTFCNLYRNMGWSSQVGGEIRENQPSKPLTFFVSSSVSNRRLKTFGSNVLLNIMQLEYRVVYICSSRIHLAAESCDSSDSILSFNYLPYARIPKIQNFYEILQFEVCAIELTNMP